jgi:hypothetical protein
MEVSSDGALDLLRDCSPHVLVEYVSLPNVLIPHKHHFERDVLLRG